MTPSTAMPSRAPTIALIAIVATLLLVSAVLIRPADSPTDGASAVALDGPAVAEGATVPLAPIVAAWPSQYTVVGTKSEPLYVEHITSTRDGDVFALRIEVIAQGDSALGTQVSAVRVQGDGSIEWLAGCTKDASGCADDPALRGFLSAAVVEAAVREGRTPDSASARTLHGVPVVCVRDELLHPDAPPAMTDLQPCFSRSTGALLGHYSPAGSAFVGATLAEGLAQTIRADTGLIDSLVS